MNTSINTHYIEKVNLCRTDKGSEWLQLRSVDGDTITIHFQPETREGWLRLLNLSFGETWNLKTGELKADD